MLFSILLVVFSFIGLSLGHMRFDYPVARSPDFGIKGPYPCGPYGFWDEGDAVTTLSPGVVTLHFSEIVNHIGAPFRIALSVGNDSNYDDWVLLDHLGHNDVQLVANTKYYAYNITIPDINCPRCALQILNMMTDDIVSGACCSYPAGGNPCPAIYHSCANVVITGSGNPNSNPNSKGVGQYYTQESSLWVEGANETWWISNNTHPVNCQAYMTASSGSMLSLTLLTITYLLIAIWLV